MVRKKCPRCRARALVCHGIYEFCMECQLQTTITARQDTSQVPKRPLEGTEHDPLKDMEWDISQPPRSIRELPVEFSLLQSVINDCCFSERKVLFLRYWHELDAITIGYLLGIPLRVVEAYLRSGFIRLAHGWNQTASASPTLFVPRKPETSNRSAI